MVFEETVVLDVPFDEALAATRSALADHGFGALTEVDIQQTLKAKVEKDMDRQLILGACNPRSGERSARRRTERRLAVAVQCRRA